MVSSLAERMHGDPLTPGNGIEKINLVALAHDVELVHFGNAIAGPRIGTILWSRTGQIALERQNVRLSERVADFVADRVMPYLFRGVQHVRPKQIAIIVIELVRAEGLGIERFVNCPGCFTRIDVRDIRGAEIEVHDVDGAMHIGHSELQPKQAQDVGPDHPVATLVHDVQPGIVGRRDQEELEVPYLLGMSLELCLEFLLVIRGPVLGGVLVALTIRGVPFAVRLLVEKGKPIDPGVHDRRVGTVDEIEIDAQFERQPGVLIEIIAARHFEQRVIGVVRSAGITRFFLSIKAVIGHESFLLKEVVVLSSFPASVWTDPSDAEGLLRHKETKRL